MPITQDRMIALINAARDYKQAYESTRASIETHFTAANIGQTDWTQALHAVWERTKPSVVLQNYKSSEIIAVEHSHFVSHRGRNNRAAKSARKHRKSLVKGVSNQPMSTESVRDVPEQLKPYQFEPSDYSVNAYGAVTEEAQAIAKHKDKNHYTMTGSEGTSITVENTDDQQIQSDSDLEFGGDDEPATIHISQPISDQSKQSIDNFIETQIAKEEYEQKYGKLHKPHDENK